MAHILLLDDSSFQLRLLSAMLQQAGHTTVTTQSAQEALELAADQDLSAIVTDLNMPEMHGIQFIERLRSDGNVLPVLVATADIQAPTRQKCLDAGANAILYKPIQEDDLLAELTKALGGS
ncbi:MAG: response regulator [Planctomycetota bacterium]